jgi:hypothetical protein
LLWLVTGTAAAVAVGLLLAAAHPTKDEQAVRAAVEEFLAAVGHDGEAACLRLSREAQERLIRHEDGTTCARAAENGDLERLALDAVFFDYGAIEFGPEHKWASVPSEFYDTGDEFDFGELYPPIGLEQADGHWVITSLRWFFEEPV